MDKALGGKVVKFIRSGFLDGTNDAFLIHEIKFQIIYPFGDSQFLETVMLPFGISPKSPKDGVAAIQ